MNINLVAFSGRIGNEPTIKVISDKFKVVELNLAVNKRIKEKDEWKDKTLWLRCKAYNGLADTIVKYVAKGDLLYVQGSLDIDTYEKEGQKQSITLVQVDSIQLMPKTNKAEKSNLPPSESQASNDDDSNDLPF